VVEADSPILKIAIFLVTAFSGAYLIDLFILSFLVPVKLELILAYQVAMVARMFTPFLGVLLALLVSKSPLLEKLRTYGVKVGKKFPLWFAIAISMPLLLTAFGVLYAFLLGLPIENPASLLQELTAGVAPMDPVTLLILMVLLSMLSGATLNAIFAFGEEIGWRGLMLEELLRKVSWVTAGIIIGLTWSFWHAPLILLLGYNYPTNRVLGFLIFTALCIIWGYILIILKMRSGSIIHPSVMHGTLNAFPGIMFASVPVDRIIGIPVGLLAVASSATVLILLLAAGLIAERRNR